MNAKNNQNNRHQKNISFRKLLIEMNKDPIFEKRGNRKKDGEYTSYMSAHNEFYNVMKKIATQLFKKFRPDETLNEENKKQIDYIAKSDFFEDLVKDALIQMGNNKN